MCRNTEIGRLATMNSSKSMMTAAYPDNFKAETSQDADDFRPV